MKKNIIFLNLFFFIALAGLFYLMTLLISKDKAADLKNLTVEKARAAVNVSVPSINRGLQNADDISLLIDIESIARIENVSSAFILDSSHTVIIHNNTTDWNSKREGNIYDKATAHKGELLQLSFDSDHILFSVPLIKDCTLCCIFSTQKAAENANYWKIKYFTIASVTAVLLIVILYFLSKLFIVLPFERTKQKIEKGALEALKDGKYDEIADMFASENEKSAQIIKSLRQDKDNLKKILEHYLQKSSNIYNLLIILDASNNLIYAYDNSGKFLKKGFSQGDNILEAAANAELISLISRAFEFPGSEIDAFIDNSPIKAEALGQKDAVFATIVKS